MSRWKRNLIVLCFAQTLTMLGFSIYTPFIPYYVQDLGVKDLTQATAWMAFFDGGSAAAMMVFAPIWGTLADRYGRKMMLVRATAAGATLAFLMGMAHSPVQLVILRILQGVFCGTVAAANTLVATETPDEHLGQSLGVLQTMQFVGQAVGPLVGGVLADVLGYRTVFPISSALMATATISVVFLVHEQRVARAAQGTRAARQAGGVPARRSLAARFAVAAASGNAVALMVALACNSFAIAVLSPVLSLYVQSLNKDATNLSTLAGAILSASAFTSSVSSLFLGRLGDRYGRKKVLLICVLGATAIFAPQALVTSPMQLLALRAIQGVAMGGIIPTANALLAQSTSADRRGTVFGLAASAQAGGRALGPMLGAGVANTWGLASSFWVTAGIFGLISAMIAGFVKAQPQPAAVHPSAAAPQPALPAAKGGGPRGA